MTDTLSITFDDGDMRKQHLRDADRADDCPDGLDIQHADEKMTAIGSPETIRWLYDYLHHLASAWRNEGEQWDADIAEEMAESLWEQAESLPDRQRNKQLMTDGGQSGGGIERCVIVGCPRPATKDTRYGPMCDLDASHLPKIEDQTEDDCDV